MKKVFIYKRFERIWHWGQAVLILLLALTGFNMRFSWFRVFDFHTSVQLHIAFALALLILVAFAIFWHFTTGEWKQYIPTRSFLVAMIRFYVLGIFRHEPHPVKKTLLSKLNPLQRLAYLSFKLLLFPILGTTGLLYLLFHHWPSLGLTWLDLGWVAQIHVFAAYLLLTFMFGHIYLTTTGRTPTSNIKAMITGWEEIEDD